MVVGAKVCKLTDGFLWFVCGFSVGILTSPLRSLTYHNFGHLVDWVSRLPNPIPDVTMFHTYKQH